MLAYAYSSMKFLRPRSDTESDFSSTARRLHSLHQFHAFLRTDVTGRDNSLAITTGGHSDESRINLSNSCVDQGF